MISGSSAGSSSSSTARIGLSFPAEGVLSCRWTTKPVVRFVPRGTSTREPSRTSSRRCSGMVYVNVPRTATGTATSANWERPCTTSAGYQPLAQGLAGVDCQRDRGNQRESLRLRISGPPLTVVELERHGGDHRKGRQRIHDNFCARENRSITRSQHRHVHEVAIPASCGNLQADRIDATAPSSDADRNRSAANKHSARELCDAQRPLLVCLEKKAVMSDLAATRISHTNEDAGRPSARFNEIGRLPKISAGIVDHARDEGFVSLFQPGVVGHRSERGAGRLSERWRAAEDAGGHSDRLCGLEADRADNTKALELHRKVRNFFCFGGSDINRDRRRRRFEGMSFEKRRTHSRAARGEIRNPHRSAEVSSAGRSQLAGRDEIEVTRAERRGGQQGSYQANRTNHSGKITIHIRVTKVITRPTRKLRGRKTRPIS